MLDKDVEVNDDEKPHKTTIGEAVEIAKESYEPPVRHFRLGIPCQILVACWREFIAEFLGTAFLVFFGTGSVVIFFGIEGISSAGNLGIALAFGFTISCVVWAISGISLGHINPAITIAILSLRNISVFKALCYIICQLSGALLGSAIVFGIFPRLIAAHVNFGATVLAFNRTVAWSNQTWELGIGQGFFIEFWLTFFFLFVILLSAKTSKHDDNSVGKFAPLSIGFAALVCHLVGVQLTGCGINPARSFAPAVISGVWNQQYIYWIGPITGAVLAAMIYEFIFQRSHDESHPILEPITKIKLPKWFPTKRCCGKPKN